MLKQTSLWNYKAPNVAITSQRVAQQFSSQGPVAITANGAVTLSGTYAGPAGTVVQIVDGTTVLGSAKLDGNGGWTFSTLLPLGTHTLHAVATDLAGHRTVSANEPPILVEAAPPPTVAIQYETQTVGSNVVQVWGTVSGASGTTVDIFSGAKDLGAAVISGNTWVFTSASLPAGNYSFSAIATTPAGASSIFSGLPSLTVGQVTGTLNTANYTTVWSQDFTKTSALNSTLFPIVWGNPKDISFGSGGVTLTSNRSEGFANVGFEQSDLAKTAGEGYGLYSVTASHPANQGGGIALLLWPSDNVWPGPEIDILEDWKDPKSQSGTFSVHFKGPNGQDISDTINLSVDLTKPTTYALDWERGSLTYYINGQEIFQITGSEVPLDAADGGVNASFGANIANISAVAEPSNQVSLTIENMSYSALKPAPVAAVPHAASLLSAPATLGPAWSSGSPDIVTALNTAAHHVTSAAAFGIGTAALGGTAGLYSTTEPVVSTNLAELLAAPGSKF